MTLADNPDALRVVTRGACNALWQFSRRRACTFPDCLCDREHTAGPAAGRTILAALDPIVAEAVAQAVRAERERCAGIVRESANSWAEAASDTATYTPEERRMQRAAAVVEAALVVAITRETKA